MTTEYGFLDPEIHSILLEYRDDLSQFDRTLSVRELHDAGQQLLERGYQGHAETILRIARQRASEEGTPALFSMTTIDLARTMHERSPRSALALLATIDATTVNYGYATLCINTMAVSMESTCSYTLANKLYSSMTELASSRGDSIRLAWGKANSASIAFEHGAYRDAHKLNEDALRVLRESGDERSSAIVLINMATNALHESRYDESIQLADRAVNLNDRISSVHSSAYININRGELELVTGNLDLAYELIALGEKQSAAIPLPALQVQALVLRSVIEERLGDMELVEAVRSTIADLHARAIFREAAPVEAMAVCLERLAGKDSDSGLRSFSEGLVAPNHARLLLEHYYRLFESLKSKRQTRPEQVFPKFITQAPLMIVIKHTLGKLVNTDVRILLEGESGTGKSFLARQIHDAGRIRNAPFVMVDCTNLEENLFESKLFGHRRGAFTGAISDTVGLVEQADGGTLFLDEIGELPTEIQGKLLYTVEEQRYRPVGAKSERQSEFRVIAATNRDIDQMLATGTLRSDLFFRLAGFRVTIASLKDRREDIMPLGEHRLNQLNHKYKRRKSLRIGVWDALVGYSWPGNVRELNTTLERGYHLATGRRIALDDLGLGLSPDSMDLTDLSWYAIRREHLLRVLLLCRGNVTRAAQILGLNRTTLIYKLKLLDIARKDYALAFRNPRKDDPEENHSNAGTEQPMDFADGASQERQ